MFRPFTLTTCISPGACSTAGFVVAGNWPSQVSTLATVDAQPTMTTLIRTASNLKSLGT